MISLCLVIAIINFILCGMELQKKDYITAVIWSLSGIIQIIIFLTLAAG